LDVLEMIISWEQKIYIDFYYDGGTDFNRMRKIIILVVFALILSCILPLVGGIQHHSDCLNHSDPSSCAICLVTLDSFLVLSYLILVSFTASIIPKLPELVIPRVLFHPPRFLF
jgi:hypothetical protein